MLSRVPIAARSLPVIESRSPPIIERVSLPMMELVSLPIMDAHEGAAMTKAAAAQRTARQRIAGALRISFEIFNMGFPFHALLKRFVCRHITYVDIQADASIYPLFPCARSWPR